MSEPVTPLIDPFGRMVTDLRISVTDRCNFRCVYCMPDEPMTWMPRSEILTFEEITRVASICVERFGFNGIRLTGGEPLLRANIDGLVARLARLGVDLAMTTNASVLRKHAARLADAGLTRLNISLDTLDRDKFARLTNRDDFVAVLDGIQAAIEHGFNPVKINTVVERGVNDDEIIALARFGRDQGVEVRFIEFMPLDGSDSWQRAKVVGQDEIVERLAEVWPLEPVAQRGTAPASRWRYSDLPGDHPGSLVGVVPTVTAPFCENCDRIRLTADGQLRTCLFATDEFDLRGAMRRGESDDQIAERIMAAVSTKWAGHQIDQVSFVRPARSMSQIGG